MIRQSGRQSGRTIQQILEAACEAVFVWCDTNTKYPRQLAKNLGRDDLKIVAPSWFKQQNLRGVKLKGIVADHALRMESLGWDAFYEACTRVEGFKWGVN